MIFPLVSGEFYRVVDVGNLAILILTDAATEIRNDLWGRPRHHLLPDSEHFRVFEEKIAFLGEEQAEASQVDLLLVGLDLGEVGAPGQIECQRWSDATFEISAGVKLILGSGVEGFKVAPFVYPIFSDIKLGG